MCKAVLAVNCGNLKHSGQKVLFTLELTREFDAEIPLRKVGLSHMFNSTSLFEAHVTRRSVVCVTMAVAVRKEGSKGQSLQTFKHVLFVFGWRGQGTCRVVPPSKMGHERNNLQRL